MPSLYTCALFVLRLRRRPGRRAIGPDRRKAYRREPQVHFVWPIEFRLSRDGTLPAGWTLEVFDVVLSLSPSPHRRLHDPCIVPRERVAHMDMRLCESSTCSHREQHIRAGAPTGDRTRRPGTIDATPHAREHGADTAPGHLRTGLSRKSVSKKWPLRLAQLPEYLMSVGDKPQHTAGVCKQQPQHPDRT